MKNLLILLTCLVIAGCYNIDEIVITIDQEVEPGEFIGDAFVEIDGEVYKTNIKLHVPILNRDISEVDIPYIPPQSEIILVPEFGDEVWITPSGTKYHWSCWRTDSAIGEWVTLNITLSNKYHPCSSCLDKSDPG